MSRILWRDAQGVEGSVELGAGEILIGRALECAIRTEDAMVSRHHARVAVLSGHYMVEDLGSSNGIFYQEQRVMRHALRHGDAVRCGSLWLRFVEAPMAGARAKAPTDPAPIAGGFGLPQFGGPGGVPVAVHGDQTPGALGPGAGSTDPEEVPRLRRRVEQLKSELRIYRGGGEGAARFEQLDEELVRLGEERDRFMARVAELEATLRREGGDAMVQRAGAIAQTAAEIVSGLNDVLSNLRINVMAAEGEFEQYASVIPRASFELIREALRSSAGDMETARELLRRLRALAM
ncbi:MAG TPA: FHA domain-containing protein [Candidatus Acidoferrum sp.]|nr:FHA domain-containing protein [Candidatus Acidoferrum sp.]